MTALEKPLAPTAAESVLEARPAPAKSAAAPVPMPAFSMLVSPMSFSTMSKHFRFSSILLDVSFDSYKIYRKIYRNPVDVKQTHLALSVAVFRSRTLELMPDG
jgi:hypothetical protein